jgi:hypothetical protein
MIKIQGRKELCIPDHFGSNNVTYGNNQIPCANIWNLIGTHMSQGTVVPTKELLQVAEDAETFRWSSIRMLVHTSLPRKTDVPVEGNIYQREEKQRVRPLVDKFGIVIAKIESEMSSLAVRELHRVCGHRDLYPVGMVDSKIYYAPDPEQVFDAFGSRDWVRIGVFLKRPGSNFVDISMMLHM